MLSKYVRFVSLWYYFFQIAYLGPDGEDFIHSQRRFVSPRPPGAKLYIHDNSLKCRSNQQQQRILSSFSASSAMSSSIHDPNNGCGNGVINQNCSNNVDGSNQIQQTPSILAAATLPRNFNNQGNLNHQFIIRITKNI